MQKKSEFTLQSAQSSGFVRQFERALQQLTGLTFDLLDATDSFHPYAVLHETGFCRLVHQSSAGRRACEHSTCDAVQQCLTTRQAVIKTCHLSLTDVYVPLIVDGLVIGILCSGQFLMSSPTADKYRLLHRRLVALGLDTRKLEREYIRLPVCARERIEALISLLALVNRYVTDARMRLNLLQMSKREDRIKRACEFIEQHLNESLRLLTVAAAVNLSPSRFAHLFRANAGMSFTRYVHVQRLNHAAALLAEIGLPIATVAQSVGFKSQSHFNHLFRRRFGVSPHVYRGRFNIPRSTP
ncbi:MAG: PocR ligand-binding domain-containing protein [Kiritimatiellaeota bacterium]|nr:PocR ligand-binding domain-containing protein [Kiritimatiellota bacterium]